MLQEPVQKLFIYFFQKVMSSELLLTFEALNFHLSFCVVIDFAIFFQKKYFQPSLTFFFWFNWLPHWNFFAENSIHANKSDGNIILREYSIITLPQNTQYLDPFPPYSHFVVTPPLKYSKLKFNNKSPAPPLPQLLKKKKKKKVNTTKKNAPWTFPEFTWIQIVLIIKDGFRIPLSTLNKFVRNIDWEILRYI